jgi:hypothetical protein
MQASGLAASMNLRRVTAPFLAAFVIAVLIWATIGPPPSGGHSVLAEKRRLAQLP